MKQIDIQVQETQRVSNKMNPKRPTPRHIIIKMPKVKDKILTFNLKSSQRKAVSYLHGSSHKIVGLFLNKGRPEGIGKKYSKR